MMKLKLSLAVTTGLLFTAVATGTLAPQAASRAGFSASTTRASVA
jgi:hypothetical protein